MAEEATALKSRIKSLCSATLAQTCETLSLPEECSRVLDTVKIRADKLMGTLA